MNTPSLGGKEERKSKFSVEQIRAAEYATITYPTMGTLGMEIRDVIRASDGKWYVEGLVWQEVGYYQYNMPDDYHGENEWMNFPITCVRAKRHSLNSEHRRIT